MHFWLVPKSHLINSRAHKLRRQLGPLCRVAFASAYFAISCQHPCFGGSLGCKEMREISNYKVRPSSVSQILITSQSCGSRQTRPAGREGERAAENYEAKARKAGVVRSTVDAGGSRNFLPPIERLNQLLLATDPKGSIRSGRANFLPGPIFRQRTRPQGI